nr:hypothetical protein [Tanacetum cinerariifolium]
MRMVYIRDDGQEVFVSHTSRRLFGIRVPLVQEFILEFFSTCRIRDEIGLDVAGTLCFQLGGARHSMTWRQFLLALGLHTAEEMTEDGFGAYWLGSERLILDKMDLRLDVGSVNIPYLLARYLRRFATGRKKGALISGGQFVARLVEHFRLLTEERLQGLTVIAPALPIIDMSELVQLQICADQREVLDSMASDFSRFTTWTITSLARLMDMADVPYMRYSESSVEYKRRTRQRTNDASTSTAP